MHVSPNQFVLTLTAIAAILGALCVLLIVVVVRYFRAAARQQRALLLAMAETEESERVRIAADLHDGLGQLLSGAKNYAGALERSVNSEAVADVQRIKEVLDEGMVELRRVVRNLVPRRLEEKGLVAALQELCLYAEQNDNGTTVDFVSEGFNVKLDDTAQRNLYRIAQELVHNALKHAGASIVRVELIKHKDAVVLTVSDDGCGFDFTAQHNGNGLVNLRNRSKLLSGTVLYTTNVPQGTLATLRLPTPSQLARHQ